jgi:hypothetical protein
MQLPFTTEQFLDVFLQYNESVYPAQAILFLAGLLAAYYAFRPRAFGDRFISGVLAGLWIWMGIAYHLAYFARINPAAILFGILFIVQGILFAVYGAWQQKLSFRMHRGLNGWTGVLVLAYALAGYPALGARMGHHYPAAPTFGLPCPTVLFTFGMLLLCERRVPYLVLVIPFGWSLVGGLAAMHLGMQEDLALPVTGFLGLFLIARQHKSRARES